MSRIGDDDRYRRICEQINLYSERMQQTFTRFVNLSLATIGGFVWVKTQTDVAKVAELTHIARWILPALAILTIVELYLDHVGWRNYRLEEARLLGRDDIAPRYPVSGRSELLKAIAAAIIGVCGFVWLR